MNQDDVPARRTLPKACLAHMASQLLHVASWKTCQTWKSAPPPPAAAAAAAAVVWLGAAAEGCVGSVGEPVENGATCLGLGVGCVQPPPPYPNPNPNPNPTPTPTPYP